SPAVPRLLADQNAAGLARPVPPRAVDAWGPEVEALHAALLQEGADTLNGEYAAELVELDRLLTCVGQKLIEFEVALEEEPRTIDRDRAAYLQMLAGYARNVLARIIQVLRGLGAAEKASHPGTAAVRQRLLALATAAAVKVEERARAV